MITIIIAAACLLLISGALASTITTNNLRVIRWLKCCLPKRSSDVFDEHFIEPKQYYFRRFGQIPCISYQNNLEISRVLEQLNTGVYGRILQQYERTYYDWDEKQLLHSKALFVLERRIMIRMNYDWLEVYYPQAQQQKAVQMIRDFAGFPQPEKEQAYEINIITSGRDGLELKALDIQPTPLDIALYYNDDFAAVDQLIKERLLRENDKGIVLLHGLPGTGKTTYLRHLIGTVNKKVLFVSPAVAGNLVNPEFMQLLLDNPNSILVIEDAENIIMNRKYSSHSTVSNLLNISDGLLSDCLNVQIICTFNSDLSLVDDALMRKGRLIARYGFGKLSVLKAQALSNHLGLSQTIHAPATLAEITNPGQHTSESPKPTYIGFRREVVAQL
jgi:hypothetical protein